MSRMVLFVLLSIGTVQSQQAGQWTQAEQKAVEEIQAAGGSVRQIAQNDDRLEVDFHLQASSPEAEKSPPIDELLSFLRDLPRAANLNLGNTNVTDKGLAHLRGMTGLVRLYLQKTQITDKGLKHLKNLNNLTYLNLYGTAVTDAGLTQLKGLSKLQKLFLWETKVTEVGVNELRTVLTNLDADLGWGLDSHEGSN